MKNIKKIIMALLVAVLSLCGLSNVSAAGNGSITVNNAVNGKTYEIYKIFDLTYSGTETKKVAYTIDSDWEDFFKGEGASYIVSENTGSLNPITVKAEGNTNETKYINITEDNVAEFTQKALAYAANLTGNDGSKVAAGETVEFTELDLGYYLVYPQGTTDIKDGENDKDENGKPYASICSITSTLPNAEVNVKAKAPEITKTVDDNNVEVGQELTFTLTGQVPDTTGYKSYTYTISDTMTEGLKINEDIANVLVKFGNETIAVTPTYENNGFTITFNMVKYQGYKGQTITVTYNAIVTEKAVTEDVTKNTAVLTYSNNPKNSESVETFTDEEIVYSSQIEVTKVDAKDNTVALDGAKFVIKNSEGKYYAAYNIAEDGTKTIMTNVSTTEGLVDVDWVDSEENATVLVTGTDGVVLFKGVENGQYSLVEVEAPLGYNKLTGPVTVKVGYDKEETNLLETNVSHEETVENSTGTQLPSTGGVGTTMFIIIGSLLMIGSLLVLITNKRMSKESL